MKRHHQKPKPGRAAPQGCRTFLPIASLRTAFLLPAALALSFGAGTASSWAEEELPFDNFRVLIEINGTDGDAGFQAEIDGDSWKVVKLFDPGEKLLYRVRGLRSVKEQGLTENFFESAEPSCEEVPLDVVLERFPEGVYEVEGKTIDKQELESEAILTHGLPAIPVDLEAANTLPIELSWGWPGDTPGLGECPDELGLAEILQAEEDLFGFQIVVEREEPEPLLVLVVELGPDTRSIDLPDGFIEPEARYKWEVVAIGAGVDPEEPDAFDTDRRGNQVIAEDEFCTDSSSNAVECPEKPE